MALEETLSLSPSPTKDEIAAPPAPEIAAFPAPEVAAPPAPLEAPTQLPPANPADANSNNHAKSEDILATSSDELDTKPEGVDIAVVLALPILSTLAAISNTIDDGDGGGGVAALGNGDGSDDGKGEGEGEGEEAPVGGQQGELHVSSKYTKEELMARHWGMSTGQMKRVKALLRLGVCEEDLVVADRLLKLGSGHVDRVKKHVAVIKMTDERYYARHPVTRIGPLTFGLNDRVLFGDILSLGQFTFAKLRGMKDKSQDKPWTKEEQLLGYTSEQRQRMKALHTLGLTEAAFDKCRAIMLSSLGPSAFGIDAEETAASAARAAKEDEWTPSGSPRKVHQSAAGVHSLLKKSLQHQGSFLEYKGGQIGGGVQLRSIVSADGVRVAKGTDEGSALPLGDPWRRASDSLKGLPLPIIQAGITNLGPKEPGAKDMVQPTKGDGGGKTAGGLLALTARTDPG